jgi:hypothetical protein
MNVEADPGRGRLGIREDGLEDGVKVSAPFEARKCKSIAGASPPTGID